MAQCEDIFEQQRCWDQAEHPHEIHWADPLTGRVEWPNEDFRPLPRRVDNPRQILVDIWSKIPPEQRPPLIQPNYELLSAEDRAAFKRDWIRRTVPAFRQVCVANPTFTTTMVWEGAEWPGKGNGRWMSDVVIIALGQGWCVPVTNEHGREIGERMGAKAVTLDGHLVDQNKIVPLYRSLIAQRATG